jgi:hypothetical protein
LNPNLHKNKTNVQIFQINLFKPSNNLILKPSHTNQIKSFFPKSTFHPSSKTTIYKNNNNSHKDNKNSNKCYHINLIQLFHQFVMIYLHRQHYQLIDSLQY